MKQYESRVALTAWVQLSSRDIYDSSIKVCGQYAAAIGRLKADQSPERRKAFVESLAALIIESNVLCRKLGLKEYEVKEVMDGGFDDLEEYLDSEERQWERVLRT